MKKGFTLVELVIVIAIVIVLSVVSVPIYRSNVNKAKMSEGYALLGTILSAQKAYYSEYGNFVRYKSNSTFTCNDELLGIDARGNKYFSSFRPGSEGTKGFYFAAQIVKPDEINTNGKKYLSLWYNLTSGSTIQEIESN